MSLAQEIFEFKCVLKNIEIKLCTRIESGVKQLLALVTSDDYIILHYTYGELPPVIKRIPWLSESNKVVQAICFDPSATWLLAVCVDGSLYIIPALSLVDKKQKVDCKWSLNDVTHFPKHCQTPESIPTAVVWWQTLDCNQNALVGYENGAITLISLTDGRCLGTCDVHDKIIQLCLCQDNTLESVSLLINGQSNQQWRLMLEQNSIGYLWPPEMTPQEDSNRSRLYNLKQMGVDKLAFLKQRLVDVKNGRRDSQSDSSSTDTSLSHPTEPITSGPELLPCLCDTYFAPQYAKNRYLFSAFYKPTDLLTVHAVDIESAPLYVHKLIKRTNIVLLTDRLIYTIDEDFNKLSIVSTQLSECRMDGDSEFNNDALMAQFCVGDEQILQIFKLSDLSFIGTKHRKSDKAEKIYELPKKIQDLNVRKPRIDTCVVVTNKSIYKVVVSCSPVDKFINLVIEDNNLERAERLSIIFGLNLQHLLECCGDLMISRGSFHSGIILYKQAKVHLLKRVLKLAIAADCRTLLKFVHLCLSASKVDMSIATKIHIGNLAVMAYTELILRYGGQARISNTKDFMNFLRFEEFYDQILAVNVACQAGHWNIITILAKCRGLQPEVVAALGQILQSARAPRPTDYEFLIALSEFTLTQSILVHYHSGQEILKYIRTNIEVFPTEILQRFAIQLDPSQPSIVPLISRSFMKHNDDSSLESTLDSIDYDNPDRALLAGRDLIETFILVILYLVNKLHKPGFNVALLNRVEGPEPRTQLNQVDTLPDIHPLSCGYEHAGVIRNSCLYMMGVSNAGCLGSGPVLTSSSPPKLVQTLSDVRVKALSVSCGRKHTLLVTDYGLYAWGSNTYGQLGLCPLIQETPYPQMVTRLSFKIITGVAAGQYHSVALTSTGEVYTWGWGIHGQLGHGNCDNLFYPKLLPFEHQVVQVAAGHAHSFVLTKDGKLFGFGSDVFGQLGTSTLNANKTTRPVQILLMPEIYVPIEKIVTSYFHNIAVRVDQEVYIWGANPQEVRIQQSKSLQKQNGLVLKDTESWRSCVRVYTASNERPIDEIAIGYRHSAILHQGRILWGKSKEDELSPPKLDKDKLSSLPQKFLHISCGFDYTMALDHTGKLLAWGSSTIAQTILGKSLDEDSGTKDKVIICKNTRRIIKFSSNLSNNAEYFPIEVPGLPTMRITFDPVDHCLLFTKNLIPYAVLRIENEELNLWQSIPKNLSALQYIHIIPKFKFGQKTLHYILETYHGLYDFEKIMMKCLDLNNYQAASKIALLNGQLGDSLSFQLQALRKYIDSIDMDLDSIFVNKESFEIKEKEQAFVDLVVKNIREDFNEKNNMSSKINSPAYILSQSSSLDSIRQWGDDLEHQGGCESPCQISDSDIRHNMNHYVQSIKTTNDVSPTNLNESNNIENRNYNCDSSDLEIKDEDTKLVIQSASKLIEFYLNKIYISENPILMQNALMKCIEFWLTVNLPVPILENILLKHLDKYFYPLSILLFCKNFNNELEEEIIRKENNKTSTGFFKEFSTKFCLQLCAMVLEDSNKA